MASDSSVEQRVFTALDYTILLGYFVALMVSGIYTSLSHGQLDLAKKRLLACCVEGKKVSGARGVSQQSDTDTNEAEGNYNTTQFFLADRNLSFWIVGCSLFASNIGSEHFIGLAGSGAKSGLCVTWGEWLSTFFLLILGYVFVPFYLKSQVFTMPEFLERRYSKRARAILAVSTVLLYIMTKISVSFYAGAIVLHTLLDWDIWVTAILLIPMTSVYVIVGGLKAVAITEVVQTVVLVVGGFVLLFMGLHEVGGIGGLVDNLPSDMTHIFQPSDHPYFPWTGVLFGMPFVSLWYWATDQVIVQRVLAAKNLDHAQGGTVMGGFFKILPGVLMVVPGMIARALYPETIAEDENVAFPLLVSRLLPSGLLGLMVAAVLAALMSSIASIFNSCSTIITLDLIQPLRPELTERQLVMVGRVSMGFLAVLGLMWIPIISLVSHQLYVYTHKVMAYVAPPISVVFVMGISTTFATPAAGTLTLAVGMGLGLLRLLLEIAFHSTTPEEAGTFVNIAVKSNFLHFAAALGPFCVAFMCVVSRFTEPPTKEQLRGITFKTFTSQGYASDADDISLKPVGPSSNAPQDGGVEAAHGAESGTASLRRGEDGTASLRRGEDGTASLRRGEDGSTSSLLAKTNKIGSVVLVVVMVTLFTVLR